MELRAICTGFKSTHSFLGPDALATSDVRPAEYRCPDCGGRLTFDALMASCRCVDEPESTRQAD